MTDRSKLTKSLHTVTVVTNVARELARLSGSRHTALALTERALEVLGYDLGDFDADDDTVQRCIASVAKLSGVSP